VTNLSIKNLQHFVLKFIFSNTRNLPPSQTRYHKLSSKNKLEATEQFIMHYSKTAPSTSIIADPPLAISNKHCCCCHNNYNFQLLHWLSFLELLQVWQALQKACLSDFLNSGLIF